jgi:hypothetical protein
VLALGDGVLDSLVEGVGLGVGLSEKLGLVEGEGFGVFVGLGLGVCVGFGVQVLVGLGLGVHVFVELRLGHCSPAYATPPKDASINTSAIKITLIELPL